MSRPVDRVAELTEMLRKYWENLVRFESSFKAGEDLRFYTLVRQCVQKLLYEDEEQRYETNWRKEKVWRPIRLKPGEAEQEIRGHVRGWLRQAREAVGTRWHATEGIDDICAFVEQWFGVATDPAKAVPGVPRTQAPQTERVVSVSSPGERALRERVAKLARENGELEEENEALEEQNAALEAKLAKLRAAQQLLEKQLDESQWTVENLRKQVALLEKFLPPPQSPAPGPAETRMPVTTDMRGLMGRMKELNG